MADNQLKTNGVLISPQGLQERLHAVTIAESSEAIETGEPNDYFTNDSLPPLVAASTGSVANPDPGRCLGGFFNVIMTTFRGSTFFRTARDLKNHYQSTGLESDTKGLDEIGMSVLAAALVDLLLFLLVQPFRDPTSVFIYERSLPTVFYRLWTPTGWVKILHESWNYCGRPGGGLPKRVEDGVKALGARAVEKVKGWVPTPAPFPQPELAPIPVRRTVLVNLDGTGVGTDIELSHTWQLPEFKPIELYLPPLSPEASRRAAVTATTLLMLGAMLALAPVGI